MCNPKTERHNLRYHLVLEYFWLLNYKTFLLTFFHRPMIALWRFSFMVEVSKRTSQYRPLIFWVFLCCWRRIEVSSTWFSFDCKIAMRRQFFSERKLYFILSTTGMARLSLIKILKISMSNLFNINIYLSVNGFVSFT